MSPRTPFIAGNWKMHKTVAEAEAFIGALLPRVSSAEGVDVAICPPYTALQAMVDSARGSSVQVYAQNMHEADDGAFTGEVSAAMLTEIDVQGVILGHSERRQYDNETDEAVAVKVASAIAHGLVPIAAIGERAEERRAGETSAVIDRQLRAAISQLDQLSGSGLVIAYEPVWAIGTGDAATGDDAQAVAAQIRAILHEADPDGAHDVAILYGGSCTPENAPEFFAMPDIDGALVGGASLDATRFAGIVRVAAELRG